MPHIPHTPRRHSIRLPGRDYSSPGRYYLTICTNAKACLFGRIALHKVRLTDSGKMIRTWRQEIERAFPHAQIEAFIIMPNHIHAIIRLHESPRRPSSDKQRPTLGRIVQWFKTMTTNAYIRGVRTRDWPQFDSRLWQRDYFERVLRNEDELLRVSQYIRMNPAWWDHDPHNPKRHP